MNPQKKFKVQWQSMKAEKNSKENFLRYTWYSIASNDYKKLKLFEPKQGKIIKKIPNGDCHKPALMEKFKVQN